MTRENSNEHDPLAPTGGYAGAGKRARRDAPPEAEPENGASGHPDVAPAAPARPVWGEDPRPVVEEGLAEERTFWSGVFEQSGNDPQMTATGTIPVLGRDVLQTPATVDDHEAFAHLPEDETQVPYDPFAPGSAEPDQPVPVTPAHQTRIAEYTVEVPVLTGDRDAGPSTAERPAVAADADPQAPAATPPHPDVPWTSPEVADVSTEHPHDDEAVPARSWHDPDADPHQEHLDQDDRHQEHRAEEFDEHPTLLGGFAAAEEHAEEQDGGHAEDLAHEDPAVEYPAEPVGPGDSGDELHEEAPAAPLLPGRHGGGHADEGGGRSKVPGCLIILLVLALLGAGGYFAADKGVDWVRSQFGGGAEDFSGPGKGSVDFEVKDGDSAAQMGRNLKAAGVVKSVDAFTDAASDEPKSRAIQVGHYALAKEMKAADVVKILIDPDQRNSARLTIPEGLRAADIIERIAEETDLKKADLEKALKDGKALGLPAYAKGNAEGFLFPATYDVGPKATAASVLKMMVDRWHQSEQKWDLEKRAASLDLTPYELMTVASLVQAEGRGKDMNKIARVLYNRLDDPTGPTVGLLQVDASVNYGLDRTGVIAVSSDDLAQDTPYNTYKNKGLPPTPINNMGDEAIDAATDPAKGNWLFYVTVDLKTGETKFTDDYQEFLGFKAEYKAYCETSDAC